MKIKNPPILSVRRIGDLVEYYIQQGNKRSNFFLDRRTFETLLIAQEEVAQAFERQAVPPLPLLRVIGAAS